MPRPPKSLIPAQAPRLDLINMGPINGKDIADIAMNTLREGESLLRHWHELEPIVTKLTEVVRAEVDSGDIDKPVVILSMVAGVVEKLTRASSSIMKASEGLGRLTFLVMGGVPQRPDTRKLSEKQLAGVVVEACKRMYAETKVCPVCTAPPIEVSA